MPLLASPGQVKFHSPTSISDKGCLQKEKKKKKEKFLRTFPQVWLEAGSEGGAYSLIRRGSGPEAPIGARGPGPGERAWGEGRLRARGSGSRRERVNFKSGAGLLRDGHAPTARPPAPPPSLGPGAAPRHPPLRGGAERVSLRRAGSRDRWKRAARSPGRPEPPAPEED